MSDIYTDVKTHYDELIEEGNDPIHDSESLKIYMDKWDGPQFIEDMQLSGNEIVLEIGVGTGRLAIKICEKCRCFYGIDISPKTIKAAKSNLPIDSNIHLICEDYLAWETTLNFDVIYSSLTFLHIKEKKQAIEKTYSLLVKNGKFILSIEKNQDNEIDYGTRKVKTYPDTADTIERLLKESGFAIIKQYNTDFANIFVAGK